MTKLKITVTKEVLEKSKYCGTEAGGTPTENCAIAVAIRDLFPGAAVGRSAIFFYPVQNSQPITQLPEIAQEFIHRFDNLTPDKRIKMDPVSFEIEIPDVVINSINIDELKPLLENHPTLELIS